MEFPTRFLDPPIPPQEGQSQTREGPFLGGPIRMPGDSFQLRVRKEKDTKDTANARLVETWTAQVPIQQQEYYRTDLPGGGLMTQTTASPRTPQEASLLAAFPGTITINQIREALRRTENNTEKAMAILRGQEAPNSAGADSRVPEALQTTYMDMMPLSSRTDKRDFRQAQPYDPAGPNLSLNPYFDRYDPTRDPRNMIREVRSVVYEVKEAERGAQTDARVRDRIFSGRYGEASTRLTQAYELMRPKTDNPEVVYWGKP